MVPSIYSINNQPYGKAKLECFLNNTFSSLSKFSEIEELTIQISEPDNRDVITKKRVLPCDYVESVGMGNLFLPSLLKLHLKFHHIYGSAYRFQAIYVPKLHRVSTNFAVPCLESQCHLFDVDSGSNLDNQCFNNYIGAGTETSLVQGITYDRTMNGSFGLF